MSLIQFPQKGNLRAVPTVRNPLGQELTIGKFVERQDVIDKYRDYDFRGSYARFPEVGEGHRRDRIFAISQRFPISVLVSGALFAKDLKGDIDAHNQLMKIFQYLKQENYRTIPAKILPEELIGYVVNLVGNRSAMPGGDLPELHYLHLPYFGSFIVSGWSSIADVERDALNNPNSVIHPNNM